MKKKVMFLLLTAAATLALALAACGKTEPIRYTVAFESDGGGAFAAQVADAGGEVSDPGSPTKAGYTFAGWYEAEDFSGNPVSFPYTPAASLTLYAKYTPNGPDDPYADPSYQPISSALPATLYYGVETDFTPDIDPAGGYALFSAVITGPDGFCEDLDGERKYTFNAGQIGAGYKAAYTAKKGEAVRTLERNFSVANAVSTAGVAESFYLGAPADLRPTLAPGWRLSGVTVADASQSEEAANTPEGYTFAAEGVYTVSYTADDGAGGENAASVTVFADAFEAATDGYSADTATGARALTATREPEWRKAYYYREFEGDYSFSAAVKFTTERLEGNYDTAQWPKVGIVGGADAAGNEIAFYFDPKISNLTDGRTGSYVTAAGGATAFGAPCGLDSENFNTTDKKLAANTEYTLKVTRIGDDFYFYVNDVLYQVREAVLSGPARAGICAAQQDGVFWDFSCETENVAADAGRVRKVGGYANFTHIDAQAADGISLRADETIYTGAKNMRIGFGDGVYEGEFDLSFDLSGLIAVPAEHFGDLTPKRIVVNLIRADGKTDGVAFALRTDNGKFGLQYISGDGGDYAPLAIGGAQGIVNATAGHDVNVPAGSGVDPLRIAEFEALWKTSYGVKITRRITDGKTVLSVYLDGVLQARTSGVAGVAMAYDGDYKLGFTVDQWGGVIGNLDYDDDPQPPAPPASYGTIGGTANGAYTYTVTGDGAKTSANTAQFLAETLADAFEVKFKLANGLLDWGAVVGTGAAAYQLASNSTFMPLFIFIKYGDTEMYDIVALDFSTASYVSTGGGNIGTSANKTDSFIALRLKIGATSTVVQDADEWWTEKFTPSTDTCSKLGNGDAIRIALNRRIVKDGDGTLKTEYNVSFNFMTTQTTDVTFAAKSGYIGGAAIGFATQNTNVSLGNIWTGKTVNFTEDGFTTAVPIDFTASAQGNKDANSHADGTHAWAFKSVAVYKADGEEVTVTSPGAFQFPEAGTYTVVITAEKKLNNSSVYKTSVFAKTVTVT
ncbi:MAG: InlB B-repeat-containing protein [Clostridiales bacterium]|jgi:uncharacterized repeat protein (TIGR02543 family)|nr:InlB B-repeat-containing protein [Clostridiales bacterium]